MKRFLISVLTGIITGCLLVWGADKIAGTNLLSRIKWSNKYLYIFSAVGFAWAVWLSLWNKCLNRFIWKQKTAAIQPAPTKTNAVETKTQQQPIQTQEKTAQQPTQTPTNGVVYRPANVVRPMAMAAQSNAVMSVNPANPSSAAPNSPLPMAGAPTTNATISPATRKEHDIAVLSDIDPDLDMMAFKHVSLEGKVLDLVYSSDDVAVLCKLFSDEHTWTVDTTQTLEDCTWTNEEGTAVQPCKELLAQAAILEKMETEAEIIPTIVFMRGQINDYDNVVQYLLQNNIYLVQYESDTPGVKTLHELLKEKFVLFTEGEEVTEEEPVNEE